MTSYVNQVAQIGLIVVVVIAAGAFSFDSRPGMATFLRTRASGMWQLIGPRFTVNALAAAVAYLLGSLAAWYETALLIGPLPAGEVAAGILCGTVYLAFAVAVTGAAASLVRGTLATLGVAIVVLLLLPLLGTFRAVHDWLPSALVNAPVDLLTGTSLSHFLPAVAVAAAAAALALAATVSRMGRREI
jgi:ABC-2 type transport system permease protein